MVLVDPALPEPIGSDSDVSATCARAAENGELIPDTAIFAACGLQTEGELRKECDTDGPAQCELDQLDNNRARSPLLWKAIASEIASSAASSTEVLQEERNYGSLPLIVLTRDKSDAFGPWKAWKREDDHIASLSSDGKDFVVVGSSHAIQLDHPIAVIWAIDRVLDQVRSRPSNAKAAAR
jgi:hypothetical protein